MRFAHFADCHLGSWRQPELQKLNLDSFKKAIDICIEENVTFIIFAGDLFDSAYPPIEILKEVFSEFRRLNDSGIKNFIIAGSHDYSVSGKTFLDVLEKAGFCKICPYEGQNGKILLKACNFQGISIYGYPGKKSSLELEDLKRIQLEESNNFKILILHTTMESAKGNLPIDSISINDLPDADYYALGHLHITHEYKIKENKYLIYPGPIFPNNFSELQDLQTGSFYIVDINGFIKLTKKELRIKEVVVVDIEIDNTLTATEKILYKLSNTDLNDKILLLKIKGKIKEGKTSDIRFQEISEMVNEKKAFVMLKNTNQLVVEEPQMEMISEDINTLEESLIEDFSKKNESEFNKFIFPLMNSFNLEKQEDEKNVVFESRLLSEINRIFNLENEAKTNLP